MEDVRPDYLEGGASSDHDDLITNLDLSLGREIDCEARPFAALHEAMWRQVSGELDAAEGIFLRVRAEPAASIARRQLDLIYRQQRRWADAIAVMRQHAAAHPANAQIAYHLGTPFARRRAFRRRLAAV